MAGQRTSIAILIGGLGLGGAERQLRNFLAYANHETFDYHVIVLNQDPNFTFEAELRSLGITIWQRPDDKRSFLQRLRWLIGVIREINPALFHSWVFYTNAYVGLVGILAGVPVKLGSVRGQLAYYMGRLSLPHRWMSYHLVDGLIVNSHRTFSDLQQRRTPAYLIHNGVEITLDYASPDPPLSEYGIGDDHRLIITVGNIRAAKNQRMLIDTMARVLPDFPDVRCLIIGQPLVNEPDLYDQLKGRIAKHGLAQAIYLTGVREDVPALMQRASIFSLTSKAEGTPNAMIEAMVAGLPVVATAVGDIPYVIADGKTGFLVDVGDIDEMEKAIRRLLNDPALAAEIGAAGREIIVEEYSCEQLAQTIESLYTQFLSRPDSG